MLPAPTVPAMKPHGGVTPHRMRQLAFLEGKLQDKFMAVYDHSVPVCERGMFGYFKVHLCPEGRMFSTHGMRLTHTDRSRHVRPRIRAADTHRHAPRLRLAPLHAAS